MSQLPVPTVWSQSNKINRFKTKGSRQKAQDRKDIISPQTEKLKQQRLSYIARGQSIKTGCSFKVIFKQWDCASALYLIVSHGKRTKQAGVCVHEGLGLARISVECK
jgi:hypothetical protein